MKKTNWLKKILSFVLAIVMVAGMINMPAKATETYSGSLNIAGAGWFATQNTENTSFYAQGTDAYLSSEGEDWTSDARKMQAAEADSGVFIGNVKQTNGMLNKIIGNANGFTNIYQITGIEANEGDIITIKGTFTTLDGTAQITFTESKFKWTGSAWEDYVEIATYESTLTLDGTGWYGTNANNTSTALYVHGTDTYLPEAGEAWSGDDRTLVADNADSGVFFGTVKQEGAKILKLIGGVETASATHIYYISGIEASEGTVLTVKGSFTTADGKAKITFAEASFKFTGSAWEAYADIPTYNSTLTLDGTGWYGTNANNTSTALYVHGTDTYLPEAGEAWSGDDRTLVADNADSGVFFGTVKQESAKILKLIGGVETASATHIYYISGIEASEGTVLTVKGSFTTADGKAKITFAEASFKFTGSAWEAQAAEYNTSLTIEGAQDANTQLTAISLKGTDTYLSDRDEDWSSEDTILSADIEDEDSGIFIGTIKQDNAKLRKYYGTKNWYWANGFAAQAGDVVTIKGTFYSQDGGATVIVEEAKFAYIGGKWIDYAGSTDTKLTSLMVDSKDYYPTFQEDRNLWYAYFKTDVTLLGTSWEDGESYTMTLSDGTSKCDVVAKKAGDNVLFVEIPADILPEGASKALTIRAGEYVNQGNNFGIRITEDFTFYVNQYGWSADESKITSALEQPVVFSLNTTGDWPLNSAAGFYLVANVEDGAQADMENWSKQLNPLKTSDNTYYTGGVWKGDVQTEVYMIKLSQTAYYVALSDWGYGATTAGETYTVKGLFKDPTGRVIGYQPITVKWNGSSWEQVYTSLVDTEVQHDVNSDMAVDSRDLVRMLRHMDNSTISINDNQKDINYSGEFNADDKDSLRKVLLGMIYYVDGKVYGTPVYNDNKVIEKMAYVCPELGSWNDDNTEFTPLAETEIDTILQKYKAAGLTLLNTEYVAQYQDNTWDAEVNEPIRVYLEAAKRNDLGVLVFDSVIQYMLTQKNPAVYGDDWQGVIESHIQTLKNYSSFRGFMIWDEMTIEYVDTYNQIVSYIREAHPELLLVTSLLPVTVYDQTGTNQGVGALTTNTSASKEEAYRDYVWSYAEKTGHFIYDLYPLVYSEDKIFGYTYDSEYGVVDDWYLNLQYVANEVKEQDYSFTTGITIQACKLSGWSNNTSSYETYAPEQVEDIGFQVYTAMAYGVKDINYFTYADHWNATEVEGGMTEHPLVYDAVSAVNAEIDKFADVYQSFSWRDTLDVATGTTNSSTGNERLASVTADGARTFVGCMKDTDGFDGYMIANASGPRDGISTTVTLTFNDAESAIVYIDGVESTVELTGGVYTVTVPSGEGVFVIPLRDPAAYDVVDFVVEVPEGEEITVLQLTDTQIMDAANEPDYNPLDTTLEEYYATENKTARCYKYLTETINATEPDLILLTGDIIYGDYDPDGTVLQEFVNFMEEFKIPWAPVFGNHDNESDIGVDAQCDMFEAAEYCLFEQRELTGNGNYTVGISQGGVMKRVFFMLDSNGCGAASEASLNNGHTVITEGFGTDQIEWYTQTATAIRKLDSDIELSFAFHIQLAIFQKAYEKYGFTNVNTKNNPINIDTFEGKAETDFGYIGRDLKNPWDGAYALYNDMKDLGVDSIFVGHEHCNSASVVYDGVRFQFGQKSSTYDRANYKDDNGNIVASYSDAGFPLVGGTVMTLSDDGSISDAYIYYCENE